MADTKVTKRLVLNAIKNAADGMDFGTEVSAEDVINYVDTTIGQLDAKAAKAKERAAEKRAEGDELRAKIASFLTDEFQTIADITEQVDDPEVTSARVSARLSQLVKNEEAVKEQIKVDGNRKLMGYKKA